MTACLLYSTWPDVTAARACARRLVDAKLAACVTVFPVAHSCFRWEGAVDEADEAVMLAKTSDATAAAARAAIIATHPYDLPCVLALGVDQTLSNPEFLQWVARETTPIP